MTEQCVSCQVNPADFDIYLCESCATDLQIKPETTRWAYSAMVRIFYEFSRTANVRNQDGKLNIECQFYTPAVHFHNARRLHYFFRLAQKVSGVAGNFVECGVGKGESLVYLATLAYDDGMRRKVWGFDSFIGPKAGTNADVNDGGEFFRPTDESMHKEDNIKSLMGKLAGYGIPALWLNQNLSIGAGYFETALNDLYDKFPIALLHLDCNYYQSYKTCLDLLYPFVIRGGIITFDEYASSLDLVHFPGAKRAIDEFLNRTGETLIRDEIYGKYHLVKHG